MSARDDYTRAPLTQATYEAMCDEIDRLRAEVEALREANHQWFTKALDNRKGPRWQQALDSMDERQVPTVLREFWHPAPEEVIIDHG